jgi:uncharacterized protein
MRLFFATDLHASLGCFKKFVAARHFYRADLLVLGGDLTGKGIVPLVRHQFTSTYSLYGQEFEVRGPIERQKAIRSIESVGFYPVEMDATELSGLADSEQLNDRFQDCIARQIQAWDGIAAKVGSPIYVIPGNDDVPLIDSLLMETRYFINCDRKVVEMPTGWSILGFSASNPTPWKTFRELGEREIADAIDQIMERTENVSRCIWNVHVPPADSNLDVCEALDERFRVITRFGQPQMRSVGSTAVAKLIRKWQPPLVLCGHVHESRGFVRIGKTLCINPGSEYFAGTLDGCVVDVDCSGVKNFQLTSG